MRVLRGGAGALLWIVASVVSLVALLLCVTVVLLPLGIPLFMLARRLFGRAVRLFMPRAAAHPLKTSGKASKEQAHDLVEGVRETLSSLPSPDGRKARKKLKKKWKKVAPA